MAAEGQALFGVPPKQSKKAEQKRKERLIEDKTFGLKNKNKSKAVQQYINQVSSSVRSGGGAKGRVKTEEERKREKKAAKEAKAAAEAELAALFNQALISAPSKTGGSSAGKGADAAVPVAVETKEKVVQETVIIEEGEKTIEDLIEEQRAKLLAEGKQGTPVTAESLAKWKADRAARRREEERKLIEAELKKKKGGKGLSVLSGRALFEYDQTLFIDDDAAAGEVEMNQRNEEAGDSDTEANSGGGGGGEEGDGGGREEGDGGEDDDGADDGVAESKESDRGGGSGGGGGGGEGGVQVQEALFAGEDVDLDDLDEEDEGGEKEAF